MSFATLPKLELWLTGTTIPLTIKNCKTVRAGRTVHLINNTTHLKLKRFGREIFVFDLSDNCLGALMHEADGDIRIPHYIHRLLGLFHN